MSRQHVGGNDKCGEQRKNGLVREHFVELSLCTHCSLHNAMTQSTHECCSPRINRGTLSPPAGAGLCLDKRWPVTRSKTCSPLITPGKERRDLAPTTCIRSLSTVSASVLTVIAQTSHVTNQSSPVFEVFMDQGLGTNTVAVM